MIELALCANGNLTRDEVYELMVNRGDYVMETKYDGIRCTLEKNGTSVTMRTRSGVVLDIPHITQAARRSSYSKLILDGELTLPNKSFRELLSSVTGPEVSGDLLYIAFDIMDGPHAEKYVNQNYLLRHTMLYDLIALRQFPSGGHIQLIDQYNDPMTAMDQYDAAKFTNAVEGFVLKKKSGLYIPGRSLNWLRSKFVNTISVMPFDVRDDGRVLCGVWTGNGNQQIVVATVQVPGDDLVLMLTQDLNVVIELEAYGVDERNTTLRHPVYKSCRFDVDMTSCTADQLETLRSF